MEISVVIPTFNGAHKLHLIIQCLKLQTIQPKEVIIVVDGSTDNTFSVLENLKKQYALIRIINQENKGRAAVRNKGAAEAVGDLLVFFDDDMLPEPKCIEQHLIHHQKNPVTILTGGLCEVVNKGSNDILKYRAYLSQKWNNELKTSEDGKLPGTSPFLMAANCSIPKQIFQSLGGFDERLRDAEDFDLAVKALKAGVALYFKQDVFAYHNDAITCKSYIKRQRQYTRAHEMLASLKPWMKQEGFIKPTHKPLGLKENIYILFLSDLWINAADKNLLKVFPKEIRYKLYDLIISANGVFFPEKVPL